MNLERNIKRKITGIPVKRKMNLERKIKRKMNLERKSNAK